MTTGRRARGRRWQPLAVGAAVVIIIAAILTWRARPDRVAGVLPERREVVRTLVLTGRVRPTTRPQVGATASGRVVQLLVREGDHVSGGQLLVQIDDSQQMAMLAEARAALSSAAARSRSTLEQAELTAETTVRDAGRARVLFAQGAISEQALQEAERAASSAAAEFDAARATSGQSVTAPLAEVARARAAVAAAEAQLALTRITAPAAGIVLTRRVEPGDAVLPGQLLLELESDGATELVAFAREENLAELKVGAPATASADAFPNRTFQSRVSWLAPVIDRSQGTVEVRLAVPAPPDYLRADMTTSVNVEVARRSNALVVPVVQKSREIGILRATGTRRSQILGIFLIQGSIVGLLGSAVGIVLGVGLNVFFSNIIQNPDGTATFPVVFDVALYLRSAVLAIGVGLTAAIIPARRAARTDPARTIRSG